MHKTQEGSGFHVSFKLKATYHFIVFLGGTMVLWCTSIYFFFTDSFQTCQIHRACQDEHYSESIYMYRHIYLHIYTCAHKYFEPLVK